MKKIIIQIVLIFCTIFVQSQQWGGASGTTGSIWRTDKVGIGTSSPNLKLHIRDDVTVVNSVAGLETQSDASFSGLSFFRSKSSGQSCTTGDVLGGFQFVGKTSNDYSNAAAGVYATHRGTAYFYGIGYISTASLDFNTRNSSGGWGTRLIIDRDGKVGIGTTTPTTQLHTTSGVRFQGLLQNNTLSRILAQDNDGNLSWRDATTLGNTQNIYNSNGTLNSNRIVTMGTSTLDFNGGMGTAINSNNGGVGTLLTLRHNNTGVPTSGAKSGLNIQLWSPSTYSSTHLGANIDCGGSPHQNLGLRINVIDTGMDYSGGALVMASSGRIDNIGLDVRSNGLYYSSVNSVGIIADATGGTTPFSAIFNGNAAQIGSQFKISDARVKKEVSDISSALDIVAKIAPKKYFYDNSAYKGFNLENNRESYGVIAQELKMILPTLVTEIPILKDKNFIKEGESRFTGETLNAVNYTELIPITIAAIKELNTKVEKQNNAVIENEALKSEIASLKDKVALYDEKFALLEKSITTLCESGCAGLEKKTDMDALYQSIPNPTDDIALINYYLVNENSTAEIKLYLQEGKELHSFSLEPRKGNSSVKVSLGNLSNGTYLYSLIVDGKIIDTKRLQILK